MALELKKIFSILKIKLSVLNKGKTYMLVLRFFKEYIMSVIKLQLYAKEFSWSRGEHISKNIFLFPISLIREMVISTNIYKLVLVHREKRFQG